MKVIQIVPHVGAESSGPSYSVPGLCRGLAENGVETELHFLGAVPERLKGVAYRSVSYPRHDKFNLGSSSEMLKGLLAACKTVDIIHSNSLWMMPNVYPAWAVKGTKCKLVVAPRGTLAAWSLKKGWLKKKIFGWLLQNQVLRRADMFHATSEKEYEEIRALGYKQPVAIVPIGMDVPERGEKVRWGEGESGKSGEKGRRGEGEKGIRHRIVFFGRLHKVKAVDRLIQAWELLTKQDSKFHCSTSTSNFNLSDWELVIAGPDGGVRSELESYIVDHKIPRIRFVGEINGPAKYDFLSSADLYVLPSHTENFAVTVAEALACGTPVIVSKGTPWSGVVDHHCGWWVDNTPESLAAAIREAISLTLSPSHPLTTQPSQLSTLPQMGENGREWIRRDFSWEGVGAKMKAAYEWLLNDGERPEYVKIK